MGKLISVHTSVVRQRKTSGRLTCKWPTTWMLALPFARRACVCCMTIVRRKNSSYRYRKLRVAIRIPTISHVQPAIITKNVRLSHVAEFVSWITKTFRRLSYTLDLNLNSTVVFLFILLNTKLKKTELFIIDKINLLCKILKTYFFLSLSPSISLSLSLSGLSTLSEPYLLPWLLPRFVGF